MATTSDKERCNKKDLLFATNKYSIHLYIWLVHVGLVRFVEMDLTRRRKARRENGMLYKVTALSMACHKHSSRNLDLKTTDELVCINDLFEEVALVLEPLFNSWTEASAASSLGMMTRPGQNP